MNLSEALNFSVKKIVKQGGQCLNEDGSCCYGDGDGNHCAVGWLLDDDDYELMRSTTAINALVRDFKENVPEIISENLYTFKILQRFHDVMEKRARLHQLEELKKESPDVDYFGSHWQEWINMGKEEV